jgi:outer membrane murein-binding lipoprotein Lpp
MKNRKTPPNYLNFARKIIVFFLIVLAVASLSGCITFLTELRVRGDGSGTMVQTITMNPEQMKKTVEAIAKQMGGTMTESKDDAKKESPKAADKGPFKEDELKGKAADLGQGVTFVSAEQIDTKTAAGVRVTYAFKDINKLSINPKPGAAMGMDAAGASSKEAVQFRFKRMPNGNAVLTIRFAQTKPETKEPVASPPPPSSPEETAQQQEMIRQMFKGLHMGMAIDVEGKIVKTNSPYVEGSKVTLMDIDFDPLFSDEKGFKTLSEKLEKTMGDDKKTMEALKGVKGLKIVTDPEVSIEFAPK